MMRYRIWVVLLGWTLWAGGVEASTGLQARLISAAEFEAAPRIVPVLSDRRYLARGDGLLVRDMLAKGSEWGVFRPTRTFSTAESSDPAVAEVWGMLPVARVRVSSHDEQGSHLIMTDWLQEVRAGDRLLALSATRLQMAYNSPPPSVRVLGGLQERTYLAPDDWLVLDRGARHGLIPGQRWRIERGRQGQVLVADIEVKHASELLSLARVIRSQGAVQAGDIAARDALR